MPCWIRCGRQDPRPRPKRRACSAWRQRRTDRDGLAMRSGCTRWVLHSRRPTRTRCSCSGISIATGMTMTGRDASTNCCRGTGAPLPVSGVSDWQHCPGNRKLRPKAPDADPTRPALSTAPSQTATRSEPRRPLDGTYAGSSQANGSSSPDCGLGTVRLEVRNSRFSLGRDRQVAVSGDGTFSGTNTIGRPPVVQFWTGRIVGDGIEAEVRDPACTYHVSLKRVSP